MYPTADLVACLSDGDEFVRFRAARVLGFEPDAERATALPALITRFTEEANAEVRSEVVYSLELIGPIDGHDRRPALVAFLKTPRPPQPEDYPNGENDPWTRDRVLRTHVLVALGRMPSPPDAYAAVLATFTNMRPAERQFDTAALAAAMYLGTKGLNPAARDAVLAALRAQWQEHTKGARLSTRRVSTSGCSRSRARYWTTPRRPGRSSPS